MQKELLGRPCPAHMATECHLTVGVGSAKEVRPGVTPHSITRLWRETKFQGHALPLSRVPCNIQSHTRLCQPTRMEGWVFVPAHIPSQSTVSDFSHGKKVLMVCRCYYTIFSREPWYLLTLAIKLLELSVEDRSVSSSGKAPKASFS